MKHTYKLALTIAVFTGSTSLQATSIGASVEGGLWGEYSDGGVGTNYAYVEGDQSGTSEPLPGNHTYKAEASFDIGALTPVLKAEVYTDDISPLSDPFISARAYGLQTYQNTSGSTQTYTLNLSLHGDVFNDPSSYIDAEVGIFAGSDIFADYTSCSGAAEYLRGFDSWTCGAQLETGFLTSIEISADGEQTILDTVSFDIAAGGTFTIYAELSALSFGGHADAFSTLSMNFDDTTNLVALGDMSTVPVPAAAWLFGSGLVGLAGVARRKTRV